MHADSCSLVDLSDTQLLAEVRRLAAQDSQATAALIASLRELDARRLYVREGYSSLFTYCTVALGLSELGPVSIDASLCPTSNAN